MSRLCEVGINRMMEVFTYLIRSLTDSEYYTGIAKDPFVRLKLHNKGNQTSTKNRGLFELVYFKKHESYLEARKHEKWLKKKNKEYKDNLAKEFDDAV